VSMVALTHNHQGMRMPQVIEPGSRMQDQFGLPNIASRSGSHH